MKISVVIVTKDRRQDVYDTIIGFQKQTYKNFDIIVIDNASSDGTTEMMKKEFPEIQYLWLPDNFDIRSINIGVEMSDADIIWRTDSDSHPESPDTFEKIIDIFSKHDDIDIISSEDIEVRKNNAVWEWYPLPVDKDNVPEKGYPAHLFPGTGAAIRMRVFEKIGGFWEFGFEEIDFCTRAIVAGFNVRYFPNIRTLHFATPVERDNPTRYVQISKQFVRYNWRYFPFFRALARTFVFYTSQIIIGVLSRMSPLVIMEVCLAMAYTSVMAYRTERNVVPKEKLKDITLGVNLAKSQFIYFREVVKKNLKKWFKK